MAKASKLVAIRNKRRVLLVRSPKRRGWMLPGGRRRRNENALKCLKRELDEELPRVRTKNMRFWKKFKPNGTSDFIFLGAVRGSLKTGSEVKEARYLVPWKVPLTPTTRKVCLSAVTAGYLKR